MLFISGKNIYRLIKSLCLKCKKAPKNPEELSIATIKKKVRRLKSKRKPSKNITTTTKNTTQDTILVEDLNDNNNSNNIT